MKKISDSMITEVLQKVEKPLITNRELSEKLGLSEQVIMRNAKSLGISPYKILEDNRTMNAYDEDMMRSIIENIRKKQRIIRVNKLEL